MDSLQIFYTGCPYEVLDSGQQTVPQMGMFAVMWPILNLGPIINLEQLKLQSSNFVHM